MALVDGVEIDEATGRITRIVVRRGLLFLEETAAPASLIVAVGDDGIMLGARADQLKRLKPGLASERGTARS